MDSPPVFEFGTPLHATYPPWYDPSYWYAGLRSPFDLSRQFHSTLLNLRLAGAMLLCAPGLVWWIVCGVSNRPFRKRAANLLLQTWWCWLPALCLIAGYSLVFIDTRYIASAIVVVALTTLAAGFCGSLSPILARAAAWLATATCVAFLAYPTLFAFLVAVHDLTNAKEMIPNDQFQVSRELLGLRFRRGAKIAYIGNSMSADWARLLDASIVAEVPVGFDRSPGLQLRVLLNIQDLESFWRAAPETQQKVLDLFRQAGAEAVAADFVPEWANTSGWIRLETPIAKEASSPWIYLRFFAAPTH